MKLPSQMKYQMEKKGMNSMKKRSLKKKGKAMHKMPDGKMMEGQPMEVMPKGFSKMKKMNKGGKAKYC
jgi:hypothetical protein